MSEPTCTAASQLGRWTRAPSFAAYRIDVRILFAEAERSPGHLDFPASGWHHVADEIPALAAAVPPFGEGVFSSCFLSGPGLWLP